MPSRRGRQRSAPGGYNFGWNVLRGQPPLPPAAARPGHVPPVLERTHCAGLLLDHRRLRDPRPRARRALYGRYVYGDLCDGRLRVARAAPGPARAATACSGPSVSQLVSFGEDGRGRVYAVSLGGAVYRIAAR